MTTKTFRVGSKTVGYGRPVFIIAEAGVNHNGRLDLALKLIDAAADAGADAVKFQTFKAEEVVIMSGKMAKYQKKNIGISESQLAMLKKLELPEAFYPPLIKHCVKRKIVFLSTPHGGFGSVDLLEKIGIPAFKFGSGDLTNLPLLAYAARLKKPMIVATGMGTLAEVRDAMRTVYAAGNRKLVLLHATTNYPCPWDEVHLRSIQTMMKLDALVGYSDHTNGIQVPIMATTLGACVYEKHFTLDRNMPGPDHKASLEPDELKEMVTAIRRVPIILGSAVKRPNPSELTMMKDVRKSVVAKRTIKKGERFTRENLAIKRPGTGLSPKLYLDILGKKANKDIEADSLLRPNDY